MYLGLAKALNQAIVIEPYDHFEYVLSLRAFESSGYCVCICSGLESHCGALEPLGY